MPAAPEWWSQIGASPPDGLQLEPEYVEPYARWRRSPSPATSGRLLKALNPVLGTGLRAYGGQNASPLLRSQAKRIALQTMQTYNPEKGPLRTHILGGLQALQRLGARQAQMISAPTRVVLDKQVLDRADQELREELGRDPSSLELADRTGLSLRRQTYVRRYVPGFAQGQFESPGGDDDGPSPSVPAVEQADPIMAKAELLYHDLDPVGQAILEHTLGLHGREKLAPSRIAAKLNVTPGAISQRAAKIQAMFDELGDLEVF